jgi:hypothetical protein
MKQAGASDLQTQPGEIGEINCCVPTHPQAREIRALWFIRIAVLGG